MENVPPASLRDPPLLTAFQETPLEASPVASSRKNWSLPVWAFLCLIAGFVLPFCTRGFDSTAVLFLNKFVGRSAQLDGSVELITDTFILHGAVFVAFLWYLWFKDKCEESRIRLFMGAITAVLAGLLSRLLQLALPFHLRPLCVADLHLTWPIGVGSDLSHWNCFPSDHAALFFAFATLIWINDGPLGVFALFWAAITSATRIYLGYHYPTDIIGGAALGICLAIVAQRLPFPRGIARILEWERCSPSSFYAVAFIASYQAGTLFNDLRAIAHFIGPLLLRHPI